MKLGTKNRIRRVLEKGWGQRWSSAVLVRLWKEIGVFDGLLWYLMRKTTGGRSSERLQRSRVVEALGEPMLSLGSEAGDGSLFYAVGRETFLWLKIKGGVLIPNANYDWTLKFSTKRLLEIATRVVRSS